MKGRKMKLAPKFKPVNRHLLIVPHFKKQEDNSGVLLPEDYKPREDKYISATVLDVAPDCSSTFLKYSQDTRMFQENSTVIVDRSMVETVNFRDKDYYIILENYVCGKISEL
tara:strand:+ start:15202 stop:15537 length:336 start_codon:yes stop_codon:yes gene_type:complete